MRVYPMGPKTSRRTRPSGCNPVRAPRLSFSPSLSLCPPVPPRLSKCYRICKQRPRHLMLTLRPAPRSLLVHPSAEFHWGRWPPVARLFLVSVAARHRSSLSSCRPPSPLPMPAAAVPLIPRDAEPQGNLEGSPLVAWPFVPRFRSRSAPVLVLATPRHAPPQPRLLKPTAEGGVVPPNEKPITVAGDGHLPRSGRSSFRSAICTCCWYPRLRRRFSARKKRIHQSL